MNDLMKSRYRRQVILPTVGEDGQARLLSSSVLIIGLGGLGCPVALYLTAAGTGRIGLADSDCVSEHNLQRQTLYSEQMVGRLKADAALERLSALSSHTRFDLHRDGLTADNARDLIAGYDLIIDCTDNFATRYLIDDTCRELAKPWIMGAISEFDGMVALFTPGAGKTLDSIYGPGMRAELCSRPAASGGVLGSTPGVVGAVQATEALKYLSGMPTALDGKLFTIDLLSMTTSLLELT